MQTLFVLERKGAHAQGHESPSGFTVEAGSTASKSLTNVFVRTPGLALLRKDLILTGVLVDAGDVMRFSKDHEFRSPSAAAAIICGNPVIGRLFWRTKDGVSLKDVEVATI